MPGLVRQMVEFLGSKKFQYISFFVDDRSDYNFVHHHVFTFSEETIKAKYSYKYEMRKYGKEVRHYRVENVTHSVASCNKEINGIKKTLTFYGVGSHRQN